MAPWTLSPRTTSSWCRCSKRSKTCAMPRPSCASSTHCPAWLPWCSAAVASRTSCSATATATKTAASSPATGSCTALKSPSSNSSTNSPPAMASSCACSTAGAAPWAGAAATLEATLLQPTKPATKAFLDAAAQLSLASMGSYRALVYETPGFTEYFFNSTPIREIAELNIGSRPASRKASQKIEDLRAIPWGFSWGQCRLTLPGWYGFGSAVDAFVNVEGKDPKAQLALLQKMYRQWPFFRTLLSNMDMVLAKSDLALASRYSELVTDARLRKKVFTSIEAEWHRTAEALTRCTACRSSWCAAGAQGRGMNGCRRGFTFPLMGLRRGCVIPAEWRTAQRDSNLRMAAPPANAKCHHHGKSRNCFNQSQAVGLPITWR